MLRSICIFAILLLFFPSSAQTQTSWFVSSDNSSGPWEGSPENPFQYIQEGIDVATDGDMVLVFPGTYLENIDFLGKAITVKSQEGAEQTIIDGGQSGSVVKFVSGEGLDSLIEGFTITNGSGTISGTHLQGGGIYCLESSPLITSNLITNNGFCHRGAGIFCSLSSAVISNNVISDNSGGNGGGIYPAGGSASITNNVIIGNSAIYSSSGGGGGIFCVGGSSTISNNLIVGNYTRFGGGLYGDASCSVIIENNTFFENSAEIKGGGICIRENSTATITNTILWNNNAPVGKEIYIGFPDNTTSLSISYSDVEGSQASVFVEPGCTLNWGGGMIDSDPLFLTGFLGDYYLLQTIERQGNNSPCVDTGDPSSEMIEGTTRTDGMQDEGVVDMGYHYPLPALWYVDDDNNSGPWHGSEQNPFQYVQNGIYAASDGDTVLVMPGYYVENINFLGKAIKLISNSGPEVTTIDGSNPADPDRSSVVLFESGEGPDSIIEGFQITNGSGTLIETLYRGAGICCIGSSPKISNNIISGNSLTGAGGGVTCYDYSEPIISNNLISNNTALGTYGCGGGIDLFDSSPVISNNIISDNFSTMGGGGIVSYKFSYPIIENNIICRNTGKGGGIRCFADSATIRNNVIYDNSSSWGGAIYITNSSSLFINNTIVNNIAASYGGGVCCNNNATPTFINCIFWGNNAPNGKEIYVGGLTSPSIFTINYSDVEGGLVSVYVDPISSLFWGPGMLAADPLFINISDGNFHIHPSSPCIDAGDNFAPSIPLLDYEGDPRIVDGNRDGIASVDMGTDEVCFQRSSEISTVPVSPPPIRTKESVKHAD